MNDIRLIAIDLDGTLFRPDESIAPEDIAALRKAAEKGITIAFSSGRLGFMLRELGREILPNTDVALIGANGAQAFLPDGTPLFCSLMQNEDARWLLPWLAEKDIPFLMFEESCIYPSLLPPDKISEIYTYRAFGTPLCHLNKNGVLAVSQSICPLKLYCMCPSSEMQQAFCDALRQRDALEFSSSSHNAVEVTRRGVNKGVALQALASALQLSPQQVMAIGDNGNDVPMLQAAGISVAMGNAPLQVQKLSSYVTADNSHGGVGLAVRRYALGENL